ncbi:MAG: hypothetical protein ACD_39C01766G0001 [uncultured bacterium]|nr:MAG: hypothetical protein ACD_39C01766G0001 [uncultured bacterium]
MEDYIPFFVFGGFILFFIVIVAYSHYAAKKRAEAFRAVAPRMGFTYQEKAGSLRNEYAHLNLFSRGHSQRAINYLRGEKNDVEVSIADYHYTVGHGKNSSHYAQTICIIRDPSLDLPNFFVRRENKFLDYLGKIFGGQDINFNEDEKFSSAFVLQGKSEVETRDLFNQRVRDAFSKFAGSDAQIEGQGDSIIVHKAMIIKPEELSYLLKDTFDVYYAIKARDTDY